MWIFLAETVFVLLAIALVQTVPRLERRPVVARLHRGMRRAAAKKARAVCVVFFLSLLGRVAILPIVPIPEPRNHDEFSYLLASDTFASGRLANPTHPLWHHFETFHIEHQPTYMSMYPPGPGLVLAAAQKALGIPWVGVLLATAGMCAAITWMLQAWLPPYWAFAGGLLAFLRIGLFSYWVNSYWGGALPALAGAVFLGALTRLCSRASAVQAALVAIAVAILANTRMYEGALLVAASLISLAVYGRLSRSQLTFRTVVPIVVIAGATTAGMLYYNDTVYGSPLTLPYSINRAAYATAQIFLWQAPKAIPTYRHAAMRDFFAGIELERFQFFRTPYGFIARSGLKLVVCYAFFVGPLLTIPLFWIRFRDRRVKPLVLVCLLMLPGVLVSAWFAPHYISPATCVGYALLLQAMRRVSAYTNRGVRVGKALTEMLMIVAVVMTGLIVAAAAMQIPTNAPPLSWCGWMSRGSERAELVKQLSSPKQAKHLILVRYEANHPARDEYVFNEADIDGSNVVWAREMRAESNRALLEYFKDRQVWLFEPDVKPSKLTRLR